MTVKPVDVFMNGESEGSSCPISVATLFGGMILGFFQEMDDHDLDRWTEINYTGFVGEIGDCRVILDAGPDSVIVTVDDDDGGLWTIELTGEFLEMNKI